MRRRKLPPERALWGGHDTGTGEKSGRREAAPGFCSDFRRTFRIGTGHVRGRAADAGELVGKVKFALCVSLEVGVGSGIAVYQELRARITPAISIQPV